MNITHKNRNSPPQRVRRGFTLVETVIAMGIITVMITAFLAAFGPAVQGIRRSISAKEANRLASTLEYELSILRAGDEAADYSTSFEKAYEWIKDSGGTEHDHIVLIYQYRGDPSSSRDDGTYEPQTDRNKQIPGTDYVLQSVVRRLGDSKVSEELKPGVVEGRVFYVRMNQLIFENGELVLTGDTGSIIDPTEPRDATTTYEDYPEAVITYQAQIYVLRSSIYAYVDKTFNLTDTNGDGHPDVTGKPIFTRNMAVRR